MYTHLKGQGFCQWRVGEMPAIQMEFLNLSVPNWKNIEQLAARAEVVSTTLQWNNWRWLMGVPRSFEMQAMGRCSLRHVSYSKDNGVNRVLRAWPAGGSVRSSKVLAMTSAEICKSMMWSISGYIPKMRVNENNAVHIYLVLFVFFNILRPYKITSLNK